MSKFQERVRIAQIMQNDLNLNAIEDSTLKQQNLLERQLMTLREEHLVKEETVRAEGPIKVEEIDFERVRT